MSGEGDAGVRIAALKGLGASGDVKTGVGRLRTIHLSNLDAAVAWLQIFDAADHTAVTLGTTPPSLSFHVASSADRDINDLDWGFNGGLVVACTTSDGGSSSPSTGLDVSLTYD